MKKLLLLLLMILCISAIAACSQSGNSTDEITPTPMAEESMAPETPEATVSPADESNTGFEKYFPVLGMTKEELIETFGEEPTTVDEGGLEFAKAQIRVWFGDDGTTVNQVMIANPEIDFVGVLFGSSINLFKQTFGVPVLDDKEAGFSNFDYNGIILNVNYDKETNESISAYIVKVWK